MESIVRSLLDDPFGVSAGNARLLLQIVEDDAGEDAVVDLEAGLEEVDIDGQRRIRLRKENSA